MRCFGRFRVGFRVKANHYIDKKKQYEDDDARDDPHQDIVMEVRNFAHDRRGGFLEIDLFRAGLVCESDAGKDGNDKG